MALIGKYGIFRHPSCPHNNELNKITSLCFYLNIIQIVIRIISRVLDDYLIKDKTSSLLACILI